MSDRHAQAGADQAHIDELLRRMTLEEKASLTVGRDFWTTRPVERLDIPSVWLADGPTGLRKAPDPSAPGIGTSVPATCFPTESALASSWNLELLDEIGRAVGLEAQAEGVQVVLAPGVNLKRSPLGGRNFEYFSEDPVLSGEAAAAYIRGVQSQGVGTSLKHFAANEQETGRMYVDSVVDERTLRELYLRPFEIAVRRANPWTLMAAYNRLNGVYCAESPYLLQQVLKEEWGYAGVVMSDWGAVNDRVAGIRAGLHLQMPGPAPVQPIVDAVRNGQLQEDRLDEIVRELLAFIQTAHGARKPGTTYDREAHHRLARRAAAESMTLLKNESILPLDADRVGSVALIGAFARAPRFQGAGSSEVVPTRIENAHDEFAALAAPRMRVTYAAGYADSPTPDAALLGEAQDIARGADVAVLFVGLPGAAESEGVDRTSLALPPSHDALVEAVLKVQPNVVVVLTNGSAVAMPWADRVPAIVETWLGGQASGGAVAEVLLGHVNPSGKLSETFPVRLEDTPAYLSFAGRDDRCAYTEGLFIGYRWYDARDIDPLFPFGHGLSYTTFEYRDLTLGSSSLQDGATLDVSVRVKNSGERSGQEVVQLYVHEREPLLRRPERELRAFAKVGLEAGHEQVVRFRLERRDFATYDPAAGAWAVQSGDFDILVGASSRDIRLTESVTVEAPPAVPRVTRLTPLRTWMANPATQAMVWPLLEAQARAMGLDVPQGGAGDMLHDFVLDMPIAKLVMMGLLDESRLDEMIAEAQGAAPTAGRQH